VTATALEHGFSQRCAVQRKRLRALTLVDEYRRECLAIHVDRSIVAADVAEVMMRLSRRGRQPRRVRVDNGPEFVSRVLDRWAYEQDVTLDFSRTGKPTDNAFVESINGKWRAEVSVHSGASFLEAA
jgi:putative transposase